MKPVDSWWHLPMAVYWTLENQFDPKTVESPMLLRTLWCKATENGYLEGKM